MAGAVRGWLPGHPGGAAAWPPHCQRRHRAAVAGGVAAGGGGAWAVSRWRGQAAGWQCRGAAQSGATSWPCGLGCLLPACAALRPRPPQAVQPQLLRAGRGEQREAALHQQLLAGGGTGQPQPEHCMSWFPRAARCRGRKGVYVNAFTRSAAAMDGVLLLSGCWVPSNLKAGISLCSACAIGGRGCCCALLMASARQLLPRWHAAAVRLLGCQHPRQSSGRVLHMRSVGAGAVARCARHHKKHR